MRFILDFMVLSANIDIRLNRVFVYTLNVRSHEPTLQRYAVWHCGQHVIASGGGGIRYIKVSLTVRSCFTASL